MWVDHSVKEAWKCTAKRVYQLWLKSQSTVNSPPNCISGRHPPNLSQCQMQSQLLFMILEVVHAIRYASAIGDTFFSSAPLTTHKVHLNAADGLNHSVQDRVTSEPGMENTDGCLSQFTVCGFI